MYLLVLVLVLECGIDLSVDHDWNIGGVDEMWSPETSKNNYFERENDCE